MITRCYLEITNVCNLDCVFCPKTERKKQVMSLDEFHALTDKLAGKVKFLYFHLMGEPFLHPLLPELSNLARKKGFIPVLTTNGTLLSKREEMLESLPHKIQISLHSHEEHQRESVSIHS
ncbi:MAG: radical SAM protein [Phocaeicola sp.]